MPELPEVETVKRQLEPDLIGTVITGYHLFWPKTLASPDEGTLLEKIRDKAITGLKRRGKYLILCLEQGFLVFHLRMTGRMYMCSKALGQDAWVRFSLEIDHKKFLCFSDTRKFGRIYFDIDLMTLENKLGPEPLSMKPIGWSRLFSKQSSGLKAFLLNQKKIAGLGNIYVDEVLFMSRLHPLKSTGTLSNSSARKLGANIQYILQRAIDYEGATISWYRKPDGTQGESQRHFSVYGKAGSPCPNCSHLLVKIKVCQRTTTYCPICQEP